MGVVDRAREIFTMAFEFFGQDEESLDKSQSLYSSFAKMEVRHKEYDRARVIYKVSLSLPHRLLLTHHHTNSSLSIGSRAHAPHNCTPRTPILKNNSVHALRSKTPSSVNDAFNMKKNYPIQLAIMMFGSIIRDWKRMRSNLCCSSAPLRMERSRLPRRE